MNEMMLVTIPKARKTLVNGQRLYEVGEHEFTVPEGVYSVCLNVLGAGGKLTYGSGWAVPGGSGGGGGRAWSNNIPVKPGEVLTVVVPRDASENICSISRKNTGEVLVSASSGRNGTTSVGGTGGRGLVGQELYSGGNGGFRAANVTHYAGGGGAAGYTGNGGRGFTVALSGSSYRISVSPTAGSGGGGGGGGNNSITSGNVSTYGGGAGMLGMGGSGSYGLPGANGSILNATKAYGAGGGFNLPSGRPGAARIIWGEGRAYPNIGTGDY